MIPRTLTQILSLLDASSPTPKIHVLPNSDSESFPKSTLKIDFSLICILFQTQISTSSRTKKSARLPTP